MSVRFTVPGIPVAKGRPRIGRMANGRPVNITPVKTRSYEALVALAAQEAMAGREPFPRDMPLYVSVVATLPIPASWSGRKQVKAADHLVLPTGRPDLDNFCKAAFDGCNGVVFTDDSSIVRLETRKQYGRTPGLTVECVPLGTVEGA